MKEIKYVKKVALTYEELMQIGTIKSNRCGYTTEESAIANGFTKAEFDSFVKRADKIKKIIISKGYSKASSFIIAIGTDGNYYLIDGQGRRMALKLMVDSGIDISSLEFSCDIYTEPMSFEEMHKLIIDLNTGNTNWKNKDIRRSNALASNNEEVVEAYKYTKYLQEEYGICDYMANLLTFGEKGSHGRSNGSKELSTKDYSVAKDVFTNAYIKFIDKASSKYDANGNIIERTKSAQKAIRNCNLGIAIVGCFRDIVKEHNNNISESENDIDYFVNTLLNACNGTDEYLIQYLYCDKNSKNKGWDKVKSRIQRPSVKNAYKRYVNAGR